LYYGQYFAQYDMRAISYRASGGEDSESQSDSIAELRLGVNDEAAARALSLNFQSYPSKNVSPDSFLEWIKSHIRLGHPVIVGLYCSSCSNSEYDHIVTVVRIQSDHDDDKYHDDDIITIEDHGVALDDSTTSNAQYLFNYSFKDFKATRDECNADSANDYALPSDSINYGIAILGVVDTSNSLVPVRVYTSIIEDSTSGIPEGSNTRPQALPVTLRIRVGNDDTPLTVGAAYSVYQYDDETQVPRTTFNDSTEYVDKTKIVASKTIETFDVHLPPEKATKAIFRAVLSSNENENDEE
jgi:hypothetical protein